ncbi:hypothetical protein H7100_02610 [Candidatus Saccharibacteria bacterium]|nr:hypothetical protein [Candidatus Saccharibacteria bacterium]
MSNLSFSPALVGQLGFYAKRLKKEETTRRLGLVFVALALVVQSLAVFQPPESANASSPSDFVYGGLGLGANRSLNHFLAPYDSNATNLRDIMDTTGITRAEIASAQFGKFRTGNKLGWGREPREGATAIAVKNSAGTQVGSIFGRPLNVMNGQTDIYGWIGYSAHVGWFAIMQACGNLITDIVPPPVTPPPVTPPPVIPQPTPAKIIVSKTAANISQGNVAASTVAAKENDKITFTLTIENKGGTAKVTKLADVLTDTLEYSTLTDNGGGTFDTATKTLSWPDVTLGAGEKQTRSFAVQMLSTTPATPTGQSSPESYNCIMENAFSAGDSPISGLTIPVTCAPPKVIETITTELPHTGPRENMIFAGIVLAVVTYFFLRSRQLGKEVRLIRRDLNAGTI